MRGYEGRPHVSRPMTDGCQATLAVVGGVIVAGTIFLMACLCLILYMPIMGG